MSGLLKILLGTALFAGSAGGLSQSVEKSSDSLYDHSIKQDYQFLGLMSMAGIGLGAYLIFSGAGREDVRGKNYKPR